MFPSTNNGNVDPINLPFFPDKNQHLQLDQSLFSLPHDDFFHCQNGGVLPPLEHQNSMMSASEKNKSTKCPKKDRHSKINTAHGPRDRRMRLSLKVAREFFDLQDKLGFDKASRTVEWLLIQARSAIKQLTGITPVNHSTSSPSECEVIEEDEAVAEAVKDTPKEAKTPPCNKGKRAKPSRKNAFNPQAKEMREKARAKARERTREKQLNKRIELQKPNLINQLSCWSGDANENGEDSVTQNHSIYPATSQLTTPESISDEAIGDWSPFAILSHLDHPGFPQEQNEIIDFPTMWE